MYKPVDIIQAVPVAGEPGAFGAIRKHDIHTGIDLYCNPNAHVFAVESGTVVAVEQFTGDKVGSPWWNNTWAVLIEGASGVIVYGEMALEYYLEPGYKVEAGDVLGGVLQVLKVDKGVTPVNMLHFELLTPGTDFTSWWNHGEPQPETVINPTELINKIYNI